MTSASLSRMVRDHRTGQVHMPHESVAVLGVMQNLGRTLIKIKWQAGGESVLLPEDIEGCPVMTVTGCPKSLLAPNMPA
jgi:hypothetical protein